MQEGRMMSEQPGPVLTCLQTDCSYNKSECCYAGGIEVGDKHPTCDTYTHRPTSVSSSMSAVDICNVSECYFNQSKECHAAGITVGTHSDHPDCFTMRPS